MNIMIYDPNDKRTETQRIRETYEYGAVTPLTINALEIELKHLDQLDYLERTKTADREEAKDLVRGYLRFCEAAIRKQPVEESPWQYPWGKP
jgi:hypothetical protein